jgi:hypothetical protein
MHTNLFYNIIQTGVHQESFEHNSHDLGSEITNDLHEMDDIYSHEDFKNSNEQSFEFMPSNYDAKWNSKDLGILLLNTCKIDMFFMYNT